MPQVVHSESQDVAEFSYLGGGGGDLYNSTKLILFGNSHPCYCCFAGTAGILWFVAWIFLAYSSPATHPRISKEEREYIEYSIAAGRSGDKEVLPHPLASASLKKKLQLALLLYSW